MTGYSRCKGETFDIVYDIEDDFDMKISASLQRGDMTIRDVARMGLVFWLNRRVLMPPEQQPTSTHAHPSGDDAVALMRVLREKLRSAELGQQKATALERDRLAKQMQQDKEENQPLRDEILTIRETFRI